MEKQEFWSTSQNGQVSLDNYEFKRFLETNNFFKNKPNDQSSFNLIRKDGIFLKINDVWEVKDFVLDHILSENVGKRVYNLMSGKSTIFKRDYLSMIKTDPINVLRDTEKTAYLFYKNGVVEVSKDSKKLQSYDKYNLHIWEDQVIKRDYVESDHHDSEYRTFIWLISGGFTLPENPTIKDQARYDNAVARYNTFQTVIGYLLHSYNNGCDNKAIILNDEKISDYPNGRSGKGLFWNAIKNLKKVQSLNGKAFKFTDPFPYQSVKTDCQVLVWDDVRKNFDFEQLFSVITEGIEITYKGKDTIKLPIEDSPKILITTNYVIRGEGGSHDARKFEVELSTFFNYKYTPLNHFKHKLFDSWDEQEWARFDCYMIECLKKYLTTGLTTYESISLPLKKLKVEIGAELFNCIDQLKKDEWVSCDMFYELYSGMVKKFTEKSKTAVTQSIKRYCEFHNLNYEQVTGLQRKFKLTEQSPNPVTLDMWEQMKGHEDNEF